jgi:TolB-like protein/Tfp pilus assembly protein PilF
VNTETTTGEPARAPLLSTTWAELRRRRVVRAAISYAVAVFVVLQLADLTYEPLGLPGWAMRWTILAAILGFPIVMSVAWWFDATRSGLARDGTPARKGTARLFAVFVVLLTTSALAVWLARSEKLDGGRPASDAPPNSIAVLPFDDMSPNKDQRWFADGVAEELLDRLARIEGLSVAARTSSFAFRGKKKDLRDVAAALNVSYVLEGSVRKAGGRLRVTAQLINAADGFHLWSETYERGEQDIFALQDEVTAAIATQLEQRITGLSAPAGQGGGKATVDVRAHELYLQGREAWRQRTPASLAQAREFFQQAVEIQPDYARAWSGLADTWLLEADYGVRDPSEAVVLAEPAAVRAVTIDPDLAEGWASLGLLRMTAGQFSGAKANLERAVALDPDYSMASMWLANVFGVQGQFQRQVEVLERARRISPLEPVIAVNLSATYASTGDTAAAERTLREVLAVTPREAMLLRAWSLVERERGALATAASAAYAALAVDPETSNNQQTVIQAEISLEEYDRAEAAARRLTQPRARAIWLQVIAMRRGDKGVLPELDALVAAAPAGTLPLEARDVFETWAFARWLDGDVEAAQQALLRSVGDPTRLGGEAQLANPASFLATAYEELGNKVEASRWSAAVEASTLRWLDQAPASAQFGYVRALMSASRGHVADTVKALEAAYASGFRDRWLMAVDPRLRLVRGDPAYRALLARMATEIAAQRRLVDRSGNFAVPAAPP